MDINAVKAAVPDSGRRQGKRSDNIINHGLGHLNRHDPCHGIRDSTGRPVFRHALHPGTRMVKLDKELHSMGPDPVGDLSQERFASVCMQRNSLRRTLMDTSRLDSRHRNTAFRPRFVVRNQVFPSQPAFKERFLQLADPDRVYGAFDSGRVVALLDVIPFVQSFGGRWIRSGGISSVAVAPEFRGQGLASRVLGAALVGMREGGDVVSPLFPANLRLYRQVGWELAGCYAIRKIRARHLLHLERPPPGQVRRAEPEDCPAIRFAYRRFAERVPGTIDGENRWWMLENQFDRFYTYVAVDAAGEVRGALVYENLTQPHGGEFPIHVHQIFAETRAASLALWWVLGTSSSQSGWVYYPAPPEDPLALLLPEQRQAIQADFRWMLRLVDVEAAIDGRGFPAGVEATVDFALDDPELPENAGAWRLRVEGGEGRLERIDDARLRMGIGAFSSWFSGWGTRTSLERAGLVVDAAHEGALLDACFAGPTPWIVEEF